MAPQYQSEARYGVAMNRTPFWFMADKRKSYAKFQCDSCKNVTHFVHKSKKDAVAQKKLEMKKYCRHCRKHTLHKEAKK